MAETYSRRSQLAGDTRPADALLMAAAPDLLAVAEEYMRLWQDGFDDEEAYERLTRRVEAAIAKARGPAAIRPRAET